MFNVQLAEIVKDFSDKIIFKLVLRNKKLAGGQTYLIFVVPVRRLWAVSFLITPAPSLMAGLAESAYSQLD